MDPISTVLTATSAAGVVIEVVAASASALTALGLIARYLRRPRLRLMQFQPHSHDAVVKQPEWGWGPAAWMRVRVKNVGWVAAEGVELSLKRVVPLGPDLPPGGNELSRRP
jgi:hypothetical protein